MNIAAIKVILKILSALSAIIVAIVFIINHKRFKAWFQTLDQSDVYYFALYLLVTSIVINIFNVLFWRIRLL